MHRSHAVSACDAGVLQERAGGTVAATVPAPLYIRVVPGCSIKQMPAARQRRLTPSCIDKGGVLVVCVGGGGRGGRGGQLAGGKR
jgi:hypothetical protein